MSTTLELGAPARALVAVPSHDDADASTSRWYAATNALREGGNFLRLIERDVETKTAVVSRSIALEHRACEDVDVNASALADPYSVVCSTEKGWIVEVRVTRAAFQAAVHDGVLLPEEKYEEVCDAQEREEDAAASRSYP